MTDSLKKKNILVKRAGRHFGFFKRAGRHEKGAGRHEKGAGRRALQKKPRQNIATENLLLIAALKMSQILQCGAKRSPSL